MINPPRIIPPIEKIRDKRNDVLSPLVALNTHFLCSMKLMIMPQVALIKCDKTGGMIVIKNRYIKKSTAVATNEVEKNLTIFNIHLFNRITFFLLPFFIVDYQFGDHTEDKNLYTRP